MTARDGTCVECAERDFVFVRCAVPGVAAAHIVEACAACGGDGVAGDFARACAVAAVDIADRTAGDVHVVLFDIPCTCDFVCDAAINVGIHCAVLDRDGVFLSVSCIGIDIAAIEVVCRGATAVERDFVLVAVVLIGCSRARACCPTAIDVRMRAASDGDRVVARGVAANGATAPCVCRAAFRDSCRCGLIGERVAFVVNLFVVGGFGKDEFLVFVRLDKAIVAVGDRDTVRIFQQRAFAPVFAVHLEVAETMDRRSAHITQG